MNNNMPPLKRTGWCLLIMCLCSSAAIAGVSSVRRYDADIDAKIAARFRALRHFRSNIELPDGLPETFTVRLHRHGELKQLHLWRHSVRSGDYAVRLYRDGRYYDYRPMPGRTYQGVVAGEPDSAVAAILDEDGLSAGVYVGGRVKWRIKPLSKALRGAARTEHVLIEQADIIPPVGMCGVGLAEASPAGDGAGAWYDPSGGERPVQSVEEAGTPAPDDENVPPETLGAVRSYLRLAQIAFDVDNKIFLEYGSDLQRVQNRIDEIVNEISIIYARDALITYELTGLIVRQTEFYDYELNDDNVSLSEFRSKWRSGAAGNGGFTYDLAHLITGNNPGGTLGVAYVNTICGSWAYAWSVDTVGVIAHETGHNWGLGHCNDNGDCHIMCSGYGGCNGNPTFFGNPGALQLRNRAENTGCLNNEGAFVAQLPPRAFDDEVHISIDELLDRGSLTIDVLDNDHDANFEALSIAGLDSPTSLGATVIEADGKVVYIPPPHGVAGTDTFAYTCDDAQGNSDTAQVTVDIKYPRLAGYWKLDETRGTMAGDSAGEHHGTLRNGLSFDSDAVAGHFAGALDFDGTDDYVEIPPLNLHSNNIAMTAWIYRRPEQTGSAGIIFSRDASTTAGISVRSNGELQYHWNNTPGSYNWSSGLIVPAEQWVFVGLTVIPTKAIMHMYDGAIHSSYRDAPHDIEEFDGILRIGHDSYGDRYFNGIIDDVRIYSYGLGQVRAMIAALGGKAVVPRPHNWSGRVSTETRLFWLGAPGAERYHVYFGDDHSSVENATLESILYKGPRNDAVFNPAAMELDSTYFWRVDEILSDGTFIKGNVWRFTTGGTITRQVWLDLGGSNYVSALTNSADYPDNPDITGYLTGFEAPTDWADGYGTRIHGFLQPQTTGGYTFWIAGDDHCQLWLSTDENPANAVQIAHVPGWTKPRQWSRYPEQKSGPISLVGGRKYYIQALHKEGSGGDNLAVAWQGPDSPDRSVIDGRWLRPYPANDTPVFDGLPFGKAPAMESYEYTGSLDVDASDPEGDDVSFSKIAGPDWLEVAADGTLRGVPGAGDAGENSFLVRVEDSHGQYSQSILTIDVHDVFSGEMGLGDLVGLADNWLRDACADSPPCAGADLDGDGDVDGFDFAGLSGRWQAASASGLVADWNFDDNWGAVIRDNHGDHDGVLVNADYSAWQGGILRGALSFDGVDDYVEITGYKGIQAQSSRTVSAWIKSNRPDGVIIGWGPATIAGARWVMCVDQDGRLRQEIGGAAIVGTRNVCDGRWHLVAAVIENDGTPDLEDIVLYIDGEIEPLSSPAAQEQIDTRIGPDVKIGTWGGSGRYFQGLIDEVRVYDIALSHNRIRGLFIDSRQDIVAYWDFDETAGDIARDLAAGALHGTCFMMDDEDWVGGRYGNALDFDGVDDSVRIMGYKGILGQQSRTVSAWIKTTDPDGVIVAWGPFGTVGARWVFCVDQYGRLRLEIGGGAVVGTQNVCDGSWRHVAVVFDNDGTPDLDHVVLYVDGTVEPLSDTPPQLPIDTLSGADVRIGTWGGTGRYFDGLIDRVIIHNRPLAADEIATLAH